MDFKKRLLNLLQVRENEWWLVRQLFFQQFFSGAGIALFFTAAFSLFLQKFSINELPKVLIASAFMQWITGYLYSKVEHLVSIKKLILIINVFIAASIILFRIAAGYTDSIAFFFSMLVWYNVLYLLSSLDFWGLAALLFDVRQSKRLFGIISAGDIPAKFIGYTSAFIIAPIIGTSNLLIAGAVAVLYSLVYWHRLEKSGHLEMNLRHHHHVEEKKHIKKESFGDAVIRFFENKLVLNLAILSFLICSISTLIYFVFYAKIKLASDNENLARYVALFLAFSRGIAIIMKIFFTNRITNALGIRGSLLISPVVLLIMLLPVLFMPMLHEGVKAVLFIFGLLSVTNDVLRSAILTPVFLSVMQPLRAQVRLRAHNIVKGVMDPFGLLFIGSLLYFMLANEHTVDLYLLSYTLISLLIISTIWIFIVDSEYSKMLVLALRNRYFNGSEMTIDNKETLSFFIDKSINGDASDAIFVLSLVSKNSNAATLKIIDNAMHHSDDRVKMEAIKTIERMHLASNLEQMKSIAGNTSNPDLLYESVKAIYTLNEDAGYDDYIDKKNARLLSAAVIGMLRNEKQTERGINYLKKMGSSDDAEQRIYASVIIGESSMRSFAGELMSLINDKNDEVRKAAITASGKLHGKEMVEELLHVLTGNEHEKTVLHALIENGHHSIPFIKEHIDHNKLSVAMRVKLINVISKTGGAAARKVLDELIESDHECRNVIIAGLHQSDFKTDKGNDNKYGQLLHRLLDEAAQLVFHIQQLYEAKSYPLLARALELELNSFREIILNVFTFFYSSEKIQHARTVFYLNKKENIANALEIIDVTVQKEFAQKFIALYDTTTYDQKLIALKKIFNLKTLSIDELLKDILHQRSFYNKWTKACALYELDSMSVSKFKTIIKELASTEADLVKETAAYVLEKQNMQ
ncbi:MAG: MFS transporter [Bacteroidia bacterium]